MTISTQDDIVCEHLVEWFIKYLLPISKRLTADFIKNYKPKYESRMKRRKKDKKEIYEFKKKENQEQTANIEFRESFIEKLVNFRANKKYPEISQERQQTIRKLKKSLDYPNFIDIDLKEFFSIRELGTIVAIKVKKQIEENPKRFTQLLKFICNENIPLKDRIDEGLNGKYKIDEIKEAFLSKVLVMLNPKKYFVRNKAFIKNLKPFELSFPRGLTAGERYEETRKVLQEIIKKTNIDDFATLDHCLFYV